jgi:serine protease Do
VNASFAESFGLDRARGALVSSVDEKGPAEKAGLLPGDIILKYDGNIIEHSADLPMLVADATPGKDTTIEVWRKGSAKTFHVATTEGKAERVAKNDAADAPKGRLGVSVRPLTKEERGENAGRGGLVVEQVGGAAQRAGIQAGDLVLALNGTPVSTPEELRDQVAKSGKRAALLIQRDERQLFVPVELG